MDFAICTLGCKVNQYETAALERELTARGHHQVSFEEPADVYIVNTCTVTSSSDRKSRNAIRRARNCSPEAVVAVCGCYSQANSEAVISLGADLVSGTSDRMTFVDQLERKYQEKQISPDAEATVKVGDISHRRKFELLTAGGMQGRTRAYLKVEDGCVNFCSYCIIPYVRGPVRSLPAADASKQAESLGREGYQEIVLTGIEISSWGRDLEEKPHLIDLVESVCLAVPSLRIHLGSLEPRTITEEFCRRAASLPNLCPHFHLSLQSGCDRTLSRMRRKYDTARYEQSVLLLRTFFENPSITTDLIVGFPGESEEEFSATLEFLRRCEFASVHIFPYSPRKGTPAAAMGDQISNAMKEERVRKASKTASELKQRYLEGWIGQTLSVLFEEVRDGMWQGHTPNYVLVRAKGSSLHNQIRSVTITGIENEILTGVLIP